MPSIVYGSTTSDPQGNIDLLDKNYGGETVS
jgi:hypothetical protein